MKTSILIKNGHIYDGTKNDSYVADIYIKDGIIQKIGDDLHFPDTRIIDARGLWVVPGFIDNHTHYDGEVLVSPGLYESVRHGVTSVIVGGCSLSFVYSDVEDCCDMFTRVEAFPREVLYPILQAEKSWNSPQEWIDHLHSLALGPNVASFIGHSDIRASVMGIDRSLTKEKPTDDEIDEMGHKLKAALSAGFLGVSMQHNPWDKMDGRHWSKLLPAAYAHKKERAALVNIVRAAGAHLQGVPNLVNRVNALWYMLQSASLGVRKNLKTSMVAMMDLKGDPYIRKMISGLTSFFNKILGADFRMQTFPVPFRVIAQGMELVIFEEFPTGELARHLSRDVQLRNKTISDPDYRSKFKKHYGNKLAPKVWQKDFGDAYVLSSPDPTMVGKSFVQIADERNQHPVDTFLDLVVEMDQEISWETTIGNENPDRYKPLYNDENGIIGFSDSGAHINNMAFYNFPLRFLRYVMDSQEKDQPLMTIEKAVWRLTKEIADFFNLDNGHIAKGKRADITIIDPSKLDDRVHEYHKDEFMNGVDRLVNRNEGAVPYVLINGKLAVDQNVFSEQYGKERFGEFIKGSHL